MKRKYVIIIAVLLLSMFIAATVSAATCPNCSSGNVDHWISEIELGDDFYCDGECTITKIDVYDNYGCNNCLYNWGVYKYTDEIHTNPAHN